MAIAIVVPIYKETLTCYEWISLSRVCEIATDYKIVIIAPEGLNIPSIPSGNSQIDVKYFSKYNFENPITYSNLLCNADFYNSFKSFEYILIYQLDSFIFTLPNNTWFRLGYDYFGAPWINGINRTAFRLAPFIFLGNYFIGAKNKMVGNGGFSLRNVEKSIWVLKSLSNRIPLGFHEDYIWSFYIPQRRKAFKIADFKTSLSFSFDENPKHCFELNNNVLPLGCHGWNKYLDFWAPILKKYGYSIE